MNVFIIQFVCHLIYVILSFKFHAQVRPISLILLMALFVLSFELINSKFIIKKPFRIPWASIGICNSIYLNMEGYGAYYWPFFLALFVSLCAKYLLRVNNRPIFNPSLVGVFLIATVFPFHGSAAMFSWHNSWMLIALVFVLGTFVTFKAKTIALSLSYIFSYLIFSLSTFGFIYLIKSNFPQIFPDEFLYLAIPFSIFTFGNILFAFHGIGDPSTAPINVKNQIIFGVALGGLDCLLRLFTFLAAPYIAYVILLLVLSGIRLKKEI